MGNRTKRSILLSTMPDVFRSTDHTFSDIFIPVKNDIFAPVLTLMPGTVVLIYGSPTSEIANGVSEVNKKHIAHPIPEYNYENYCSESS